MLGPASSARLTRSMMVRPPAANDTSSRRSGRIALIRTVRCAASLIRCAPALSASTMAISTMPSPSASGRSPLEVSSAMVVVITRVTPSMLPPTIITAPTSALARPRPGQHRGQQRKADVPQHRERAAQAVHAERAQLLLVLAPGVLDRLARERRDDRQHEHRLRDDHRLRREQQPQLPERPGARQQQVDEEAHHHRRQPHQRIEHHDHRLPRREAAHGDRRAERQPDERRPAPPPTGSPRGSARRSATGAGRASPPAAGRKDARQACLLCIFVHTIRGLE